MKKALMAGFLIPGVMIAIIVFAAAVMSQNFTYVGAQKCMPCHNSEAKGKQYPIWQGSNHSKSFAALSSAQAAAAAQALSVKDPATDPKCLKCHAPLFEKAPDLKAEGVACEVCHGPGSEYKKLSVMQDKEAAIKNGLKLYGNAEAIKALCLTCHESAHGKSFDFAARWDKIKHTIPGK